MCLQNQEEEKKKKKRVASKRSIGKNPLNKVGKNIEQKLKPPLTQ